jgi:hypothetical protein
MSGATARLPGLDDLAGQRVMVDNNTWLPSRTVICEVSPACA